MISTDTVIAALRAANHANSRLSEALVFALQQFPKPAVKIVLGWPYVERKGKVMANKQVVLGTTVWVPIHCTNAEGILVPAPPGDVDTATSTDMVNLAASIDVMPAASPLAGQAALKLVSPGAGAVAAGITVTVSDSAGLASETDLVDIVQDNIAKDITLDWTETFTKPT
jgi:hypothetical protein